MNPISFIAGLLFWWPLQRKGPALTFARLCTSRHLRDLQWIAFFMIIVMLTWPIHYGLNFKPLDEDDGKVVAALTAAAAVVLAWTYQSGSRRIGAVDLFACEISVICRVMAIADYATVCVKQARRESRAATHSIGGARDLLSRNSQAYGEVDINTFDKCTSEEHCTTVYDTHLSELKPLSFDVVTHVTEFYTYRKTMIDYLRAIEQETDGDRRLDLQDKMIYMQFLMYESAREAVEELIEFEPKKAESLINILWSELVLFPYLSKKHSYDYLKPRLYMRREKYREYIPKLLTKIKSHKHPTWAKAQASAPELEARYTLMCEILSMKPYDAKGAYKIFG
jgi:hypothetical protein